MRPVGATGACTWQLLGVERGGDKTPVVPSSPEHGVLLLLLGFFHHHRPGRRCTDLPFLRTRQKLMRIRRIPGRETERKADA